MSTPGNHQTLAGTPGGLDSLGHPRGCLAGSDDDAARWPDRQGGRNDDHGVRSRDRRGKERPQEPLGIVAGQGSYLTAPAAMPLMMNRSKKIPTSTSGRIAPVDSAAIDHQLIPWLPVCDATMTGSVLA